MLSLEVTDLNNGYKNLPVTMTTLEAGQGLALANAYGAVPLFISHGTGFTANHIFITWEASKYPGATIYYMTGSGTGEYVNTYSTAQWKMLPATTNAAFNVANVSTGVLQHLNQVGQGSGEAYYKGLQAGISPTDTIPGTALDVFPSVEAVGKMNYTFVGGNNFFNYPFNKTCSVNEIFGNTAFNLAGGSVDITSGSRVFAHNYTAGNFDVSELSGAAGSAQWPAMTLSLSKGNIFCNASSTSIKTTLVGRVVMDSLTASNTLGGNNLIGLVYPKGELITIFANSRSGDRLLIPNSTGSFDTVDSTGSNVWVDNAYRLKPIVGYWYYRAPGNGQMNWQQLLQ
jgi:hypothetical protein